MHEETFQVQGMHCASCSSIISKKLKKLPGIELCDVNFATENAKISYDKDKVTLHQMNNEIERLGYSLSTHTNHMSHNMKDNSLNDTDHSEHLGLSLTKDEKLKELDRTKIKLAFTLPVTFLTFFIMMWDIAGRLTPTLPRLALDMNIFNTASFILSTIILFWVGKPYLEAVVRFAKYRVANMDSLVGIGTLTAYIYSSTLFLFPQIKDYFKLPDYMYFDVAIVVIGFITLGKFLENRSKLKTGEAIEKLLQLQAKTAFVIRDGQEFEIPIQEVVVGDKIRVKPGQKIPVDGVIIEGHSSIDESMINGEPLPQDRAKGDTVIGATINKQGSFVFEASKIGSDTMLAQIVHMVEESQGSKAQIQNLADKVSSIFIPSVLVIAAASFLLWVTVGSIFLGFTAAFSYALLAFVGVLVIACPCALGLATPTAIIVGVGKGAQHGILIKNAESLEKLLKVKTVVFDKTGTLTSGKPTVTDIALMSSNTSESRLLQLAGSLENHSNHPLATAVVKRAQEGSLKLLPVDAFLELEGHGVEGHMEGKKISVRKLDKNEQALPEAEKLLNEGKTVVAVFQEKNLIGLLAISDSVKENAKKALSSLSKMGIKTVMLTGDNIKASNYIADIIGIDEVIAEVLPQEKSKHVKILQKEGFVAMVGDGINDAPALSTADVGIAMATGTDIAIESSDITLLGGNIEKIASAFKLSHATIRTVKQNLFWAFIYNVIGIPLAAGALFPIFGIFLNPAFAGLAMAMSSVSVVSNSLLLKRIRI